MFEWNGQNAKKSSQQRKRQSAQSNSTIVQYTQHYSTQYTQERPCTVKHPEAENEEEKDRRVIVNERQHGLTTS